MYTISRDYRKEIVIEKSRFICSLKKVHSEAEAQEFIKAVKKEFLRLPSSLKRSGHSSQAGMPKNSAIASSADGNGTRIAFEQASAHKPALRERLASVFPFSKTAHLI